MNNNTRKTYKKKRCNKKSSKYTGGSDTNKEIPDNLGDNVQKVATKLNDTVTKLSNIITTKEGVDYFFQLLEKNIDENGNQVKDTLNYFNNGLIDNSINIIKFITYQIKQKVEKIVQKMDEGKGKINENIDLYTKRFNDKMEEYTNKLIDTINQSKKYVDEAQKQLPTTVTQNGNKKKKTIKKSKK